MEEDCYLVTSHEAQVAEGLAALSDLRGPLVRDVLTPAGVHRLDGAAVLADGNQSCGHGGRQRNVRGVSLVVHLFSCKCRTRHMTPPS